MRGRLHSLNHRQKAGSHPLPHHRGKHGTETFSKSPQTLAMQMLAVAELEPEKKFMYCCNPAAFGASDMLRIKPSRWQALAGKQRFEAPCARTAEPPLSLGRLSRLLFLSGGRLPEGSAATCADNLKPTATLRTLKARSPAEGLR